MTPDSASRREKEEEISLDLISFSTRSFRPVLCCTYGAPEPLKHIPSVVLRLKKRNLPTTATPGTATVLYLCSTEVRLMCRQQLADWHQTTSWLGNPFVALTPETSSPHTVL